MLSNVGSPLNPQSPYSPASTIYSPRSPAALEPYSAPTTQPHQPRQRLRPWLTDQINSGRIPGLEWIDHAKMIFRIPWKHFGRPGVDEYNDAMLFRNWALHTKKYQEGQPSDISTWKTRFRCALHKLPDIQELNHLNQVEGDDPYRVYQFCKKDNEPDSASVGSPLSLPKDHNPVMLSPVTPQLAADNWHDTLQDDEDANHLLDDGLVLPNIEDIENMDLVNTILDGDAHMRYNSAGATLLQQQQMHHHQPHLQHNGVPVSQAPSQGKQRQLTASALLIKLFYKDQEVGEKIVDNPRGLRIAFNPPPPLPEDVVKEDTTEVVSHIFGPFQAEQIYFPPTPDGSAMQILECIRRGLVLQARNGEVLATRLCRAKVFYSDSMFPSKEVEVLPREHTTVIFDYNRFLQDLRAYMLGQGAKPTCERFFSFGQRWSQEEPLRKNYIYVSVTHSMAQKQLDQFNNRPDAQILISDPNMLDIIAKQIEDLSMSNSGKMAPNIM